jgi:ribose 5-phosphate isomerase RpiB
MAETIPIAADHAGFAMKERLVRELRALGYEALDLGRNGLRRVQTPGEFSSAGPVWE